MKKMHVCALLPILAVPITSFANAIIPKPAHCPTPQAIQIKGIKKVKSYGGDIYSVKRSGHFGTKERWVFSMKVRGHNTTDALNVARQELNSLALDYPSPMGKKGEWYCSYQTKHYYALIGTGF